MCRLLLDQSHGTFVVPNGARMVVGSDATKYDELMNGAGNADSEGVLEDGHRLLYVGYQDEGYVTADDWNDVKPDEMLSKIKDGTNDGNEDRQKAGLKPIYVDGWIQEPAFDATHKTVRWILGMHESDGKFINATALALGRRGYERFTLVSDGSNPAGDRAVLAGLVKDYIFDKGFRFSDYVSGDKLAGYGLAALVATGAGVTLAKTGLLAAALIFLKKFVIIIIALAAALFARVRKMFTRTKFGPPAAGPPAAAPPAPQS